MAGGDLHRSFPHLNPFPRPPPTQPYSPALTRQQLLYTMYNLDTACTFSITQVQTIGVLDSLLAVAKVSG